MIDASVLRCDAGLTGRYWLIGSGIWTGDWMGMGQYPQSWRAFSRRSQRAQRRGGLAAFAASEDPQFGTFESGGAAASGDGWVALGLPGPRASARSDWSAERAPTGTVDGPRHRRQPMRAAPQMALTTRRKIARSVRHVPLSDAVEQVSAIARCQSSHVHRRSRTVTRDTRERDG